MALLVLCDPTFKNSAWCERKIKGIRDEAARRRTTVKIYTSIDLFESAASKLDSDSSVIILFSKISYIQSVSKILSDLKIHKILANTSCNIKLPFEYSRAVTDIDSDITNALEYLYSCGKKQIGLLGVDGNSWGDVSMAQSFVRYAPNFSDNVFYAKGDMNGCFANYLEIIDKFDAVLLPNDHLAICFIEYLKEHGAYCDDLFVIGRGDSISAKLYGNGLTSITTDFYIGGRAAAELHFNRLKYGWKSADIKLYSEISVRGSTKDIPYIPCSTLMPPDISPVQEPTLFHIPTNSIGMIDSLLTSSDIINLKLIYGMLCGFTYERIAEFCFISMEAAKYRIRKIRKALKGDSKDDTVEQIRAYINKERLIAVIEEYEASKGMFLLR